MMFSSLTLITLMVLSVVMIPTSLSAKFYYYGDNEDSNASRDLELSKLTRIVGGSVVSLCRHHHVINAGSGSIPFACIEHRLSPLKAHLSHLSSRHSCMYISPIPNTGGRKSVSLRYSINEWLSFLRWLSHCQRYNTNCSVSVVCRSIMIIILACVNFYY